jgi:hypothetical protein
VLESLLQTTTDSLNEAESTAVQLDNMVRQKQDLEQQLSKLKEEAQAAATKAEVWESERTRALARTVCDKEELSKKVKELENHAHQSEYTRQQLQDALRRNNALQQQLTQLDSIHSPLAEYQRLRYLVDSGPLIEKKLKDVQVALHRAFCEHNRDSAQPLYGSTLKMKQGE